MESRVVLLGIYMFGRANNYRCDIPMDPSFLHVIDGTGVVQEPFNSDTGGNTSFLSTSWFIKMLRIEFPGAWILDYYD
ncbi:MAG: hypothetical protein IPO37_07160 [Saprospiraceae bacterium]|nr:hypothetical protein [Saprospiraceae bacterium]